ncbi:hypothetical protein ACHAXA_006639 [Cyclostephanos tholiformis]|uniref:4a-hydroxytetrahydrobiopterin dehydratase n=1 Tax=Cyclostephanos tholiformis TaxID=382380 RepID=A0ABD3R7F0_9STRA
MTSRDLVVDSSTTRVEKKLGINSRSTVFPAIIEAGILQEAVSKNAGAREMTLRNVVAARATRCMTSSTFAPTVLTPEQRSASLERLLTRGGGGCDGGWKLLLPERDAIKKTFHFVDFKQAWDFMGKVAILAEEMNHHPEWSNIYNRVEVVLTTHDCKGLSTNDVEMATKMNEYESLLLSDRRG